MREKWKLGIIAFVLAVVSILTIAGCGPVKTPGSNGQGTLRAVADGTGSTVQVPIHANRIVSIGVSTDDILIPLVGPARLVSISKLPSNWPEEAVQIKGRASESTESIMSYTPDLVVAPDWTSENAISEMRSMGLSVYVYKTPKNLIETRQLITELASIVGEEKKGQEIVANIDNRMNRLEGFLKKVPPDTRKLALYYTSMGITGGKGSTFDDMSVYAGLKNGAASLDDKGTQLSREMILQINPDIIFIPSSGYDNGEYISPEAQAVYDDPSLKGIKAVQNKEIYVVDTRWIMSYSQFQIKAIEEMAKDAYGYTL